MQGNQELSWHQPAQHPAPATLLLLVVQQQILVLEPLLRAQPPHSKTLCGRGRGAPPAAAAPR